MTQSDLEATAEQALRRAHASGEPFTQQAAYVAAVVGAAARQEATRDVTHAFTQILAQLDAERAAALVSSDADDIAASVRGVLDIRDIVLSVLRG